MIIKSYYFIVNFWNLRSNSHNLFINLLISSIDISNLYGYLVDYAVEGAIHFIVNILQ